MAEKPVGLTSAEIAGVQDAATRARVQASVLYTRRFHPAVVAARTLAQSGAIGPLMTAECRFLTTQVRFRRPDSWLFQRRYSGGGMLLWLGCHCLDLLHHITGDEIAEVGAILAIRSGEKIDVEDSAVLAFKYRSGAIGTFHAAYTMAYSGQGYLNSTGYDSYLGFNGRDGRIVWPDLEPRLLIESPPAPNRPAQRTESFAMPASTSYGGAGGEDFFRQFIAATQGGGNPPTTLDDALRTARIIEAVAASSADGRLVAVKPTTGVTGRDPVPRA
jgi:predicted dehydrogenase